MREMAPPPRHRHTGGPPVDPRFRRRWAEARRAEGRRRLRVLVTLLCIMVLLGGLLGLLHSPLMRVRNVIVEGNAHTPRASVVAAADLMGRPATLMIDAGSRRQRLAVEALPWVANASFATHWPWTIVITVTERVPVAVVDAAGRADVVDQTGRVLAVSKALEGSPALPVVEGAQSAAPGDRILPAPPGNEAQLEELLATAAAVPPALSRRDLQLAYVAGVGLVAHLGLAKALILLGDTSSMPTKLAVLEELATTVGLSDYSQVDLTVPQRPALTPVPNSGNG
ncbi:MAG: cell division protein FtsQ/DivIB [Acidimicrobiales bacterium]|jgi:cell division protein FtsQ